MTFIYHLCHHLPSFFVILDRVLPVRQRLPSFLHEAIHRRSQMQCLQPSLAKFTLTASIQVFTEANLGQICLAFHLKILL